MLHLSSMSHVTCMSHAACFMFPCPYMRVAVSCSVCCMHVAIMLHVHTCMLQAGCISIMLHVHTCMLQSCMHVVCMLHACCMLHVACHVTCYMHGVALLNALHIIAARAASTSRLRHYTGHRQQHCVIARGSVAITPLSPPPSPP